MTCRVGYARVSSSSQSFQSQKQRLEADRCVRVFQEKCSAREGVRREELARCLEFVREGDTLVVTKLDRIARSMRDFVMIVAELQRKNVDLVVLDQGIDTSTSEGRLLFNMLGAFAEFENDLRRERQFEGIQRARSKGVRFGRPKSLSPRDAQELRELRAGTDASISDLSRRFRVSTSTVYRALKTG